MTRLVDFTWKAVLVFEMETGVSVDMLDRVESDNPTVEMMCGGDCGQICSHAFLSVSLRRSPLMPCKRAPTSDFSLNLGRKACSLSAFG